MIFRDFSHMSIYVGLHNLLLLVIGIYVVISIISTRINPKSCCVNLLSTDVITMLQVAGLMSLFRQSGGCDLRNFALVHEILANLISSHSLFYFKIDVCEV